MCDVEYHFSCMRPKSKIVILVPYVVFITLYFPDCFIGRSSSWICIPIAAIECWPISRAPTIPVCNSESPAPMWWRFFSWCVHMSASRVVAYWQRGNSTGVLYWILPLIIIVHPLIWIHVRNGGIYGYKPPGISDFSLYLQSGDTYLGTSGGSIQCLYLQHACHGYSL